jgi:hypothetical protein
LRVQHGEEWGVCVGGGVAVSSSEPVLNGGGRFVWKYDRTSPLHTPIATQLAGEWLDLERMAAYV